MSQGLSRQYCSESFDMTILHDAGVDQGGFGAAESASQQLTVLREAAGLDMMFYRMQVEIKVDGA